MLKDAAALYFIGYSLPAYDHQALDLFSKHISRNAEILVISKTVSPDMKIRYASMAGFRSIDFLEASFAEFVLTQIWDDIQAHASSKN